MNYLYLVSIWIFGAVAIYFVPPIVAKADWDYPELTMLVALTWPLSLPLIIVTDFCFELFFCFLERYINRQERGEIVKLDLIIEYILSKFE